MIALRITNIKQFMGKLLASEAFDHFLLAEASISTYNTFMIDGHQNRDFYTNEEWEDPSVRPYEFSTWKQIRPICFSLIKGTHTPASFRFVLHLMPEATSSILENGESDITLQQLKAYVLTIKYDGTALILVTGSAFHTFVMDKTVDLLWDNALKEFLAAQEISFEIL